MKGKHKIVVSTKRLKYEFELHRNLTIIRGDSATGKTTLVDMIRDHINNPSGTPVELVCDKTCYVLEGNLWKAQLSEISDGIVFIDEGNEFIKTEEFAGTIQKTDNYYVIVTRESLPALPYSAEEIYGIRTSGKYGTLKQSYHEFYRIYGIITDGAAFGSEIDRVLKLIRENETAALYLPESFEWLILKSGVLKNNQIDQILDEPAEYIESRDYFSWERFFTSVLIENTRDTYLAYAKKKLNAAYLGGTVEEAILRQMEKIELGWKKEIQENKEEKEL